MPDQDTGQWVSVPQGLLSEKCLEHARFCGRAKWVSGQVFFCLGFGFFEIVLLNSTMIVVAVGFLRKEYFHERI